MKREITLGADELAAVRDEAPVSSARSVDAIRKAVFLRAAAHGDLDVLQVLIVAGTDLAVQDAMGWTALHLACQAHSVRACEMLLEAGAPVDAPDHLGHTPLHRAVFESAGRGELIGLLRAYGADPYRKNLQGVTPLALARSSGPKVASYFGDLPATRGGLWDRFRTKKPRASE
jgi:ankyrin repeat protein